MIGRISYIIPAVLFWCAWIITLCGVAASQSWCADNEGLSNTFLMGSLFAQEVGDDCDKKFRFIWWIVALNFFGGIFAWFATFSPKLWRGASSALLAAMAPLNMLAANAFYDVADINNLSSTMESRAKTALSGFAILAAASLLLLTMDSMLAWEDRNKDHSHHSRETGGRAAAAPAGTKETSTVSDVV